MRRALPACVAVAVLMGAPPASATAELPRLLTAADIGRQ